MALIASQEDGHGVDLQSNVPLFDQGLMDAITIDGSYWSQYFPYQLLILTPNGNSKASDFAAPNGVSYKATPWRFTLPIGPTSLDLDMPVASEVRPTLTGITEQHGGAPFRMIQLSGTTGIVPSSLLPNLPDRNTAPTITSSIFAGSVSAAQRVASSVGKFSGQQPNVNKLTLTKFNSDTDAIFERSTGYYQFHLLRQFLEAYVALKTNAPAPTKNIDLGPPATPYTPLATDARNMRLAFACWKDRAVYLCTLQNFRMSRSAANPMEYQYSLTLKAWGRVELGAAALPTPIKDSSFLSNAITAVTAAIKTVFAVVAVVNAIVQDVESTVAQVINGIRTLLSALKATAGVIKSLADMPENIANECANALVKDWAQLKQAWSGLTSPAGQKIDRAMTAAQLRGLGNPAVGPDIHNIIDFSAPGLQDSYRDMLTAFTPNQLRLPPAVAAAVRAENKRVGALTPADFDAMKSALLAFIDDYTELIGLGDPEYERLYGRPIRTPVKVADSSDFAVLYALQDCVSVLDHMGATASPAASLSLPNSIDYIAGLAENAGIAFQKPVSKFAIPFPYGATLEQLSLQYLGAVDRWFEIAALNGLRAPYVDEEGNSLPLLVNADAQTVIVADASQLFLGQTVYVAANGSRRQTRHILALNPVAPGYVIVTLDGLGSLDAFTVAAQARLQFFTPNTVNSQKSIFIPSSNPSLSPFESKEIPGIDQFDPLINAAGIALAVDSKLDLIFSPSGHSQLATGLQNIIQKIKIYLATPLGSILQYPGLGFRMQVGSNLSDVDPKAILNQAKKLFASDPTFTGLQSGTVSLQGPALILTLVVGIANGGGSLPVSIQLND